MVIWENVSSNIQSTLLFRQHEVVSSATKSGNLRPAGQIRPTKA